MTDFEKEHLNDPKYYWVPEDAMFKNAGDCLDRFPDMGPACLVANHVTYDELKRSHARSLKEIGELKRQISRYQETISQLSKGYDPELARD